MTEKFYLWSNRLGGWATSQGNYSSDVRLAQTFTRAEAVARARLQYQSRTEEFGVLPVPTTLVEEISA